MAIDRNPTTTLRKRRALQQVGAGGATSNLLVNSPFSIATGRLALTLDASGGLEVSSGALRVKLIDTSLSRTASGLGVALRTNAGLNISSGVGILLPASSGLQTLAGGLSILLPANPGLQLAAGGLSVLLNASSPALSLTSGLTLVLDGTSLSKSASGVKIADDGVGADQLGILTTKGDLISFSTLPLRVAVGANGTVLEAASGETPGIKWVTPSTHFIFNEVPSGTIDGANVTFTLANTPTTGTVQLFKNGLLLIPTTDYSVSGNTITFVVAPPGGSTLLCHYMK